MLYVLRTLQNNIIETYCIDNLITILEAMKMGTQENVALTPRCLHVSECHRIIDLCFVVDSSESICDGDGNFTKGSDTPCGNWNLIVDFIVSFVEALDIGEDATRVALVQFATKAYLRWNLLRLVYRRLR